jgi:hypothetical protein
VETRPDVPDTLEELQTLERQVEREWWWLHGALNAIAALRAEQGGDDALRFRSLQSQAREVDRRRVQIAVRVAELTRSVEVGR